MTKKTWMLREATLGAGVVIRRALPQRDLRRIGAWCFLDHAGPIRFYAQGLDIGPHPHIGLQTFTWMIEGDLLHRDSLGYEQQIKPKQVNLMTAGHGIAHSETTPDGVGDFHSAQLWIALPKEQRNTAPRFEHFPSLPEKKEQGVDYIVLMGDFMEMKSPVPSYSPLVAVDISADEASTITLPLRADFEYGVVVLNGKIRVDNEPLGLDHLLYCSVGTTELTIHLEAHSQLLLIGGTPYTDEIAVWWNFVVHDQVELEQAYQDWVTQSDRFPKVQGYDGDRLAAPQLPESIRFS